MFYSCVDKGNCCLYNLNIGVTVYLRGSVLKVTVTLNLGVVHSKRKHCNIHVGFK